MKIYFVLIMFVAGTSASVAQELKTLKDSIAYSLGVMIGENLEKEGYKDVPLDILFSAIEKSIKDEATLMDLPECESFVRFASSQVKMRQYESNKIAGEQFLQENKSKPGVKTLDNGLQYEILREGDGAKPSATDEVIVHYHGTLIDGTIFDSSVNRGESISFPLNRVIKGWTEILQLMPVGSKWRVYIPHDLAYGDRSAGPYIQPYSMLIFEIELLGIK